MFKITIERDRNSYRLVLPYRTDVLIFVLMPFYCGLQICTYDLRRFYQINVFLCNWVILVCMVNVWVIVIDMVCATWTALKRSAIKPSNHHCVWIIDQSSIYVGCSGTSTFAVQTYFPVPSERAIIHSILFRSLVVKSQRQSMGQTRT